MGDEAKHAVDVEPLPEDSSTAANSLVESQPASSSCQETEPCHSDSTSSDPTSLLQIHAHCAACSGTGRRGLFGGQHRRGLRWRCKVCRGTGICVTQPDDYGNLGMRRCHIT